MLLVHYIVPSNAALEGRTLIRGEAWGIGFAFLAHGPPMLLITKTLKKLFKRERPKGPEVGASNRRFINLRGKEHNFSFPSGDTA